MSTPDEEKDPKTEKQQGSGRPATKFMERPKPGQQKPSKSPSGDMEEEESTQGQEGDIGGEQYWGQGRQQKEKKDRQQGDQGKQEPADN